jgi:hypothetical protein
MGGGCCDFASEGLDLAGLRVVLEERCICAAIEKPTGSTGSFSEAIVSQLLFFICFPLGVWELAMDVGKPSGQQRLDQGDGSSPCNRIGLSGIDEL